MNQEVRRHFISDVLGIPLGEIREVRLVNTFLWKRYRWQKQGIVDVMVELNDDSKINIELQIGMLAYWDKRSLFYLSKMFTEGLLSGQKYEKLKRCVCISVLNFNLDERPEYHKVYRLRDETGHEFSDMLELHVIELNKPLSGTGRMDDWIRLFNVRTKEELDMLETKTRNVGILEAIKEIRVMNFRKTMRALHEARLKEIRDRNAREDYVRSEGIKQGKEQGLEQGENRLNCLNRALMADKRYEDIKKAIDDKKLRERLYQEYRIKPELFMTLQNRPKSCRNSFESRKA